MSNTFGHAEFSHRKHTTAWPQVGLCPIEHPLTRVTSAEGVGLPQRRP